MKDLKHMIYFEKLLDSACNDLVREAQKENRVAVGYTCFHIPEVLLNLDHCFSVRLRAPYMGSTEIATYYLASSACDGTAGDPGEREKEFLYQLCGCAGKR